MLWTNFILLLNNFFNFKCLDLEKSNKTMKVIIRREDNEMEATYEVNENEQTIQELKEMIAEHNFGPIVKEQRLEYNNRRLKNSHFM